MQLLHLIDVVCVRESICVFPLLPSSLLSLGFQIAENLGKVALPSPATLEDASPLELPIQVTNDFLVDCLGVSVQPGNSSQ